VLLSEPQSFAGASAMRCSGTVVLSVIFCGWAMLGAEEGKTPLTCLLPGRLLAHGNFCEVYTARMVTVTYGD